jgi:hypothetical protein
MNLAVCKLFEGSFSIGMAVQAETFEQAYQAAETFILEEYEQRGVDISGDTKMMLEIQEDLRERNYHCLYVVMNGKALCESGKAIAVQIIAIE